MNEVDSLTEYQHISSSLAFESQSETAPAYKIAEELLSITAFCLLKSRVGDHFWPFSSDKPKKWKEKEKFDRCSIFEAEGGGKKGGKKKQRKACIPSLNLKGFFCLFFGGFLLIIQSNFKIPFQWINCMVQYNFA